MRKSTHADIREALKKMPDGTTVAVISALTGLHRDTVRQALPSMPDVYIDRWEKTARSKRYEAKTWRAIYVAVPVPPDQPHPTKEDEHVR